MKRNIILKRIQIFGFLLYFVLLMVERILALIFSPFLGDNYALASGNIVAIISYAFVAVSLIASWFILSKPIEGIIEGIFDKKEYDFGDYKRIVLGSIVLLVGGMMHTGLTILPLQFASYGCLIAGMIARTVYECLNNKDNKKESIFSVIYLSCYSMTIPVCYLTNLSGIQGVFFYIVEYVSTFTLLALFGLSLLRFFQEGKTKFNVFFFLAMLLCCGATIALKWIDEINYFVLGAVIATSIVYFAHLFSTIKKSKN